MQVMGQQRNQDSSVIELGLDGAEQYCLVKNLYCPIDDPFIDRYAEFCRFHRFGPVCGLTLTDFHCFIPSRSPLKVHAFTEALGLYEAPKVEIRFLVQALTSYYSKALLPPGTYTDRACIDRQICDGYRLYWDSFVPSDAWNISYFTLLANQYMGSHPVTSRPLTNLYQLIRPNLRKEWGASLYHLCSEPVQEILIQTGSPSLVLELNSHWVFADIVSESFIAHMHDCLPESQQHVVEIDPLLGMSPKLLNLIARTTWHAHTLGGSSEFAEEEIYGEINFLQQKVAASAHLSTRGRTFFEDIGTSNLHMAQIYVLCRLGRCGRPFSNLNFWVH